MQTFWWKMVILKGNFHFNWQSEQHILKPGYNSLVKTVFVVLICVIIWPFFVIFWSLCCPHGLWMTPYVQEMNCPLPSWPPSAPRCRQTWHHTAFWQPSNLDKIIAKTFIGWPINHSFSQVKYNCTFPWQKKTILVPFLEKIIKNLMDKWNTQGGYKEANQKQIVMLNYFGTVLQFLAIFE